MLNDLVSGLFSVFASYPVEERRRSVRISCRYAVYCLEKKKANEAIVSDVGPRGLRLESVRKYSKGQHLDLVFRGVPGGSLTRLPLSALHKVKNKLPCKVLWCMKKTDAFEVGLCFKVEGESLDQTWVKTVLEKHGLEQGAFKERRSLVRARACINAELKGEEGAVAGLLTNIGVGGALFQSNKHMNAGQMVSLSVNSHPKLPALRVDGVILSHSFDVVSNSGLHNIQFKAIDQSTLNTLKQYVVFFLRTSGS